MNEIPTENPAPPAAAPVSETERLKLIDALRGVALLGILLMNIPGFAMPNYFSESFKSDPANVTCAPRPSRTAWASSASRSGPAPIMVSDTRGLPATAGITTWIYNHQLCVLDRRLWPYAVRSISDWKNDYLDICRACTVRDACGGVFTTSGNRLSQHLHPVP